MPYKLCTGTQQQQNPLDDQARSIAVILDINEQFKAGTGRGRPAEDIQQMASRCSAAASKLMCTISP